MSNTTTDPPRPRQPRFVLHIGIGDNIWKVENPFDEVYNTLTDGNSKERPLKLKLNPRRYSALWFTLSNEGPLPNSQNFDWLKKDLSVDKQKSFGNGRYLLEFVTERKFPVVQYLEAVDEKAQRSFSYETELELDGGVDSKFKDKFELFKSKLPPGLLRLYVFGAWYLTYRVTESSSPSPMTIQSDLEFWLQVEEKEENVEESSKGKGKEPVREPAYHTGDASGALKGH